ncbi:hypothetical protein K2X05_11800 [bacterium]|nr:hypothetical protein [bacterium]
MRIAILLFYILWIVACSSSNHRNDSGRTIASYDSIDPSTLHNRLQPFFTDGCPHILGAISYPKEDQWKLCCLEHDKTYWKGGSLEERQKADSDLHACITERGSPEAARLIYYSIRSAQKNPLSLPWGYGWVLPRSSAPHSPHEIAEVKKMEQTISAEKNRIPTSVSLVKSAKSESLTDNRCIDASLVILQRDLNKTVTPIQVYYETKNLVIGFEDTVKISSRECPMPYVFRYHLKSKKDCDSKKTNPIQLDTFEIPAQCE